MSFSEYQTPATILVNNNNNLIKLSTLPRKILPILHIPILPSIRDTISDIKWNPEDIIRSQTSSTQLNRSIWNEHPPKDQEGHIYDRRQYTQLQLATKSNPPNAEQMAL